MAQQNWRDAESYVELLRRRVERESDVVAFRYLLDGEDTERPIDLGEVDRRARAIAAAIQEVSDPGDRALLLYLPSPDYIFGFMGCLYAGVIAVPVYPPDPTRLDRMLPRLLAIVRDADARLALTTGTIRNFMDTVRAGAPELRSVAWLASDEVEEMRADDWRDPGVARKDVAFLQYTSGSTGSPKGVVLEHDQLLQQARGLQERGRVGRESDVFVSWLPPYHDLGLIGMTLQPLYSDVTCVTMSPIAFLQRPMRWLEAIHRYRGTVSGGPNFAYDLCVKRSTPEQRAALDLGCWNVAFNGAEPVRRETLQSFAEAFAVSGLRPNVLLPAYGLAEATLGVTGGYPGQATRMLFLSRDDLERGVAKEVEEGDARGQWIVSCGVTSDDTIVQIVDPETGEISPQGRVGEIWVSIGSLARGYWNRPVETAATFENRLPGYDQKFLRTGDLGFLYAGELYVAGRLKDLNEMGQNAFIKAKIEDMIQVLRNPGLSVEDRLSVLRGLQEFINSEALDVPELRPLVLQAWRECFRILVDGPEELVVAQLRAMRNGRSPARLMTVLVHFVYPTGKTEAVREEGVRTVAACAGMAAVPAIYFSLQDDSGRVVREADSQLSILCERRSPLGGGIEAFTPEQRKQALRAWTAYFRSAEGADRLATAFAQLAGSVLRVEPDRTSAPMIDHAAHVILDGDIPWAAWAAAYDFLVKYWGKDFRPVERRGKPVEASERALIVAAFERDFNPEATKSAGEPEPPRKTGMAKDK